MVQEPPLPVDESSILTRFLKVYSGLPLDERKQVVLVIGKQEINWELAYRELQVVSPLGKKIGEKLVKLRII